MMPPLRYSWVSLLICATISVVVGGAVVGLRMSGMLQRPECVAYDQFIQDYRSSNAAKTPVTLIGLTEKDIRRLNHYPVSDEDFAVVLTRLEGDAPRAVGVDFFRDILTSPNSHALADVLQANKNIVWINRLGQTSAGDDGTPGPPMLSDDRLGFNQIPVDEDHVVRRGLLYMDDRNGDTAYSLAMRLTLLYLKPSHIAEKPDPDNADLLRLGLTTFVPLEKNFGPYALVDTGGYQFPLDYANAGQFKTLTFSDILDGRFDPAAIKDNIVILGPMTQSVNDTVNTPVAAAQFGDQVHANAVDQLVRAALYGDAPMRSWNRWKTNGWIFAWAFLGGALGGAVRSPLKFAAWAITGLAAMSAVAIFAFHHKQFIPIIPPAVAWFTSAGLATSYMSFRERNDRRMLMTLFGRHVSDDVAETIWRQRDELIDKGRLVARAMEATIVFTDLKAFSHVGETMTPGVLMDWLNEYFEKMSAFVETHGGSISKFNGDSIMALFGPPLVRTTREEIAQDAINAVECALAMRKGLAQMNAAWSAQRRPTTMMRIGICTGPVVAGSLGSSERLEYTVIGDTVNIASRLESHDKDNMADDISGDGCRILISEGTCKCLPSSFRLRSLGPVLLRGLAKSTVIHGVISKDSAGDVHTPSASDRSEEACGASTTQSS